jgi:hypothetical protein
MFQNITIRFLHFLSFIERKINSKIFNSFKIYILKILMKENHFFDNKITNIVCTKLDKNGKCERAIHKLLTNKDKIFQIYPRALVFCILQNNIEMIKNLDTLGYPFEMIKYADNYHLIKKKNIKLF